MAELVKKLGLPQPDGFLYFVEKDCTVWKNSIPKHGCCNNKRDI